MKNNENNSFLVYFILLLFAGFGFAMDPENETTDGTTNPRNELQEDMVDEAIELLESSAQVLGSAFNLLLEVALRYQKNEPKDELMEDVRAWTGSVLDLGKDHGWPIGIREDPQFLGMHILRAASV